MSDVKVQVRPNPTPGSASVRVAVSSGTHSRKGGRVPVVIPETQVYYWTDAWQANETEAVKELRDGKAQRFESAGDAIKWLMSED